MRATTDTQTDLIVAQSPRPGAVKFFLAWIGLGLLGFPLGGYLGHLVAGPVDGVMPALLGGALTGAGIGLAQWVMLRKHLGVGPGWIATTSVSLAAGLATGAAAVDYGTTTSKLAIMGAICGAFVGIAQGLMMRGRFSGWFAWIVAMPALWALGWVVTDAWGIDVEERFTVFGASGSIAFGALSAAMLLVGIRGSRDAKARM